MEEKEDLFEAELHKSLADRSFIGAQLHKVFIVFITHRSSATVFFNRGSASDCQGFRRSRPKLPGTKFETTVLCRCSIVDTWITAKVP